VIGRLEVPRLGLSAIAREGVDSRTLRSAVGHVPDTALPGERGNAAFAAHRDTFFRKLKDVRRGDRVVITTPEGAYEYVVQNTRVVPPTDVSVLEPTDEAALTLVTCYPFDYVGSAPERFIVRAVRADKPKG
jgi:sortase A